MMEDADANLASQGTFLKVEKICFFLYWHRS